MIKNQGTSKVEAYESPVCGVLSFEGQVLCQTSLSGGEIQPGSGENWGNL